MIAPPSPYAIVSRAQTAWEARAVPQYLSFEIPCEQTFLAAHCAPGAAVNFIVRMSDGRTYARTVASPPVRLMCGGFIYGPASTPLAFFRRIDENNVAGSLASPPPENFAADPFGPRAIASVVVTDRAYTVTLAGTESLDGTAAYHLRLQPNYDPEHHPLRDLWVDASSFEVLQLVYARHAESGAPQGTVEYRFTQVGPDRIWAIAAIDATLPEKPTGEPVRLHSELANVGFPAEEPPWAFEPGCGAVPEP